MFSRTRSENFTGFAIHFCNFGLKLLLKGREPLNYSLSIARNFLLLTNKERISIQASTESRICFG